MLTILLLFLWEALFVFKFDLKIRGEKKLKKFVTTLKFSYHVWIFNENLLALIFFLQAVLACDQVSVDARPFSLILQTMCPEFQNPQFVKILTLKSKPVGIFNKCIIKFVYLFFYWLELRRDFGISRLDIYVAT